MKTTLPNLSYIPTGFSWSEEHGSAYKKNRAHPRTDLASFIPWIGFETQIHQAIVSRMADMNITPNTEYDIGSLPKKRKLVMNEEGVCHQAKRQVHDLVVEVLNILGIQGLFTFSNCKDNQIVGEPDFCWARNPCEVPKVVVVYKTKWGATLEDLPGYFRRQNSNHCGVSERRSIAAVQQLYGYLTFNKAEYGILSNLQNTWFFQRVETGDFKALQYFGPIKMDSASSPSMLKAFVGIVLLAENLSARIPRRYISGSHTSIPNIETRDAIIVHAGSYRPIILAGSGGLIQLDPHLCHFDRTSVHHGHQRCCTLRAMLRGGNAKVVCKIADLSLGGDPVNALDRERRNYAKLENLQGVAIPRVRGYYDVWGLLKLLALEDVGAAIPEDGPIDIRTRKKMKSTLARIHSAGYIHGDIARHKFCKRGDFMFLVGLDMLARGSPVEMEPELALVDAL